MISHSMQWRAWEGRIEVTSSPFTLYFFSSLHFCATAIFIIYLLFFPFTLARLYILYGTLKACQGERETAQ